MQKVFVVVLVVLGFVPGTAAAQVRSFGQEPDGSCPVYGEQEICTAEVRSSDGTRLDVDLTRPLNEVPGKRHPLIVMLHGFGNDKHEWQSLTDKADGADKYHWNSHWFAQHGYYVLTYTARGFRSREAQGYEPPTEPFSSGEDRDNPNGRIRLKSIESEIRDTQYLAALAASQFDIAPDQVAVTGGSYGGGESWLQASQAEWEFEGLPKLSLQVAVPKYPWTDLAYALAPNGHPGLVGEESGDPMYESSQAPPTSENGFPGNPVGSPKQSFLAALSAVGATRGTYERAEPPSNQAATTEGQIDIPAWQTRVLGGPDPYKPELEPLTVAPIIRGLTKYRSAYYQNENWDDQAKKRKVAIYSIQGWTDDLFHAVESFRMFKYLKRLDPRWPVEVELADVGHSRAQNRPEQWHRLNNQAFQFLQEHIRGSHEQETTVASQPTLCANDGDADTNLKAAVRLTGRSPEELSNGRLVVGFAGGLLTNLSGSGDTNGPATDPVVGDVVGPIFGDNNACRQSTGPATSGYSAVSAALPDATTYVGLGSVTIPYTFTGATATVHARVWDVAPDGDRELLMTRGTYRLEPPQDGAPAGTLRLPLFGNHWKLDRGHRIRLDLVEVEDLTFRRTVPPNSIEFGSATLELPTREAGEERLSGEVVATGP